MNRTFAAKFAVIFGVLALSLFFLWPPFDGDLVETFERRALNPDQNFEQLMQKVRARAAEQPDMAFVHLRDVVGEMNLDLRRYFPTVPVTERDPDQINLEILFHIQRLNAGKIRLGLDLKGGTQFLLKLDLSGIEAEGRAEARQQAIEIFRSRIDRFGVAEPIIQAVGADRILVQIPGLAEQHRLQARQTLERTARLEFRLVHPENDSLRRQALADPNFMPPVGYEPLTVRRERERSPIDEVYLVKIRPELSGRHVVRAFLQFDHVGRPYVALQFDREGARIFEQVTRAHIGHQLGIVLDGELFSAPVIQDVIPDGHAQITGQFTLAEARQLANVLENPLEAPVEILEERHVDPSLGLDSIHSGVRAALIGAAVVLVFMAAYYLFAGMVADLVLVFNLLIIIGVLAGFQFTLTLPGLAGIVLTIGMAVDANVLIYERVREELSANKTLLGAIAAGYQRAFLVIFDSNFTTIMTALILLWLGSGPVKGFGVTLTIGLLANLFAAVFVTRVIFDWLVVNGWMKSFHVLNVVRATRINFLGMRKWAFAGTWILILAGLLVFVQRGGLQVGHGAVYGIDFSGGDVLAMNFAERVSEPELRQSLERFGALDAFIQYQRDLAGGSEVLTLRLPEGKSDAVIVHLQREFPQAAFDPISKEQVGAVIGRELLLEARIALAIAVIGISLYVAFRFGEFAYGLGAVVALFHDVLMTVGWFCLTGRTFSLPVVAALLAIIGYSVNDTIVVFDRIRENRKLALGRLSYFEMINRSINQTLSRTLLTAGTTLGAAISLYFFGGRVINDFAFVFLIGVITGTYSSIFIASPIVLWFHKDEGRPAETTPRRHEPAQA
jgi:SecD/SecF fusion protein